MHLFYLLLHILAVCVTVDHGTTSPRLCHLKIRSNFLGYGFSLDAKKGMEGHFIGKVDNNSPAQAAGLIQGERLIKVNNIPIADKDHQTTAQLIKADPTQTILLVVPATANVSTQLNSDVSPSIYYCMSFGLNSSWFRGYVQLIRIIIRIPFNPLSIQQQRNQF